MQPTETISAARARELFLRALRFLRGQRRRGTFLSLMTLGVAAMTALEPLSLKFVIDALTGAAAIRMLAVGALGLPGVALAREAASAAANALTWQIRLHVNEGLMQEMLDKIHALPLEFHRGQGVGGLLTRLDGSISGYLQALQDLLTNILPALLYLVRSLAVMFRLDWRLLLLVIAFAPLPPIMGRLAAPEQTRRESALLEQWVQLYSRFNEVLTGIVTVRSFVMEKVETLRFMRGVRAANDIVLRGVRRDSAVGAGKNLVAALARVGALGLGGWLVLQDEITVGTLVAF